MYVAQVYISYQPVFDDKSTRHDFFPGDLISPEIVEERHLAAMVTSGYAKRVDT